MCLLTSIFNGSKDNLKIKPFNDYYKNNALQYSTLIEP